MTNDPREQVVLFPDDPPAPAQRHSETSMAAAEEIQESASTLRAKVLRCLRDSRGGLTDEEGIEQTGMRANTYRPRRVELVSMGLVEASGERRTSSGRRAAVWVPR